MNLTARENVADHDNMTPWSRRCSSPSPTSSPTPASSPCPLLLASSISTASSVSSISGRSVSDGALERRRGYMRPRPSEFSESARNRESVMSLGSIAHLQYYFARTGLLDGKGGHLAKSDKGATTGNTAGQQTSKTASYISQLTLSPRSPLSYASSGVGSPTDEGCLDNSFVSSPLEQGGYDRTCDENEQTMLPPTVSTYRHKTAYVEPLPDLAVLRRELREALDDARNVLKDASSEATEGVISSSTSPTKCSETQGWYDVQGLHILDIVTLAIRAAKNYYTAHGQPRRLYAIKSERQIRKDLYAVLDILKRMAARNFAGGIRRSERQSMLAWTESVDELLQQEEQNEAAERRERDMWSWQEGDWTDHDREREWLFLVSFDRSTEDTLPPWTDIINGEATPTPFLRSLQSGLRLVRLHNELVKKSRRHFGEIKFFHTDTAKPYRCAENLRYWIKAAELRWEVKLDLDVMTVVHGEGDAAWQEFEKAILQWCKAVRQEITDEWNDQKDAQHAQPPVLKVDREDDGVFDLSCASPF